MLKWQIKLSPKAQSKLDTSIASIPGYTDVVMALKWRLARDPRKGAYLVDGTPRHYLMKQTPPQRHLPSITALYTFDEHIVVILDVYIRAQT